MTDPPQTVSHQLKVSHPENIYLESPEDQVEQDIETNYPYQEQVIDQEYSRQTLYG